MKKIETSKILALYLFILLTSILVYSMTIMWQFQDLTALPTLITDIAAQILVYAIYCMKAYKAKSAEELIKLEREKLEMRTKLEDQDDEEEEEEENN